MREPTVRVDVSLAKRVVAIFSQNKYRRMIVNEGLLRPLFHSLSKYTEIRIDGIPAGRILAVDIERQGIGAPFVVKIVVYYEGMESIGPTPMNWMAGQLMHFLQRHFQRWASVERRQDGDFPEILIENGDEGALCMIRHEGLIVATLRDEGDGLEILQDISPRLGNFAKLRQYKQFSTQVGPYLYQIGYCRYAKQLESVKEAKRVLIFLLLQCVNQVGESEADFLPGHEPELLQFGRTATREALADIASGYIVEDHLTEENPHMLLKNPR
ncbi:MAG TPA: hypothetical protein VNG90_03810 [Candidatus Acidoferrum sp.]|nr:hypothetical protein [Candidatus Acidoferrum sp.]